MPKCKICARKGLFLKLNNLGNCFDCEQKARSEEAAFRKRQMQTITDFWISEERQRMMSAVDHLPEQMIQLGEDDIPREIWVPKIDFEIVKPGDVHEEVVAIQLDTTGSMPTADSIFEVSAIKYKGGQAICKFHSFINPEIPVPEDVYRIKRITDEMLKDKPTIAQVIPALDEFVGEADLISYNIDFTMKFLLHSGSRLYKPNSKQKIFDLQRTAKYVWADELKDYKLPSLCKFYGIAIPNAHTGIYTAYAVGQVFYALYNTLMQA